MTNSFLFLVVLVALVCLNAADVQAQQKYDLKYAMREGQSWTFDQVTEGVQTTDMSAEGQPPFQGEQKMRQIRKGTITVVAVNSGVPTSVKVDFDKACTTKIKMGGQEQTIDFPLAGQSVTLTRDASGKITNNFKSDADIQDLQKQATGGNMQAQQQMMAVMELASYLPGSNKPFAGKPVGEGDQWEPDATNIKQMYQLTDQDKVVLASKLASITTIGGRQAAEVVGYMSVTKKMGEMDMNNTMKGTIWYDLETGNMLQSSVDGTSSSSGVQQMNGPNGQPMKVNVKNTGKTEFRLETKVVDMGKGGNTAVVTPANPNPTNPLGGGSMAGVYKGEKLTVELVGGNGKYTGTITMGAQSFPATAEDAGGGVKGTFKVGQDNFDFRMSVSGDSATLTSGSTDYQLKKQAPKTANPLDGGGAKPANPLGAVTPPPLPETKALAKGVLDLGQFTLPDPYLRVTAWTFVAPKSWKMEGGVSWTGDLQRGPAYSTSLVVRSPDGATEYRMFPIFMFIDTRNALLAAGAEIQPVMDAKTAIRDIVLPRCHLGLKDLKVIAADALPKMAEADQKEAVDSGIEAARTMNFNSARLHVTYTLQGREVEEMIYATVGSMGSGTTGATTWIIDHCFGYCADKGKLEAAIPVVGTIAASMKANPNWISARRQELARIVASKSQPPRVAAGSGGTLSILDVSKSMARDQDNFLKGLDASAKMREQAMEPMSRIQRGTEIRRDPVMGEDLEVQSGYLHYYRDYYGKVHGSDLNASDFYTQYKINTTELK